MNNINLTLKNNFDNTAKLLHETYQKEEPSIIHALNILFSTIKQGGKIITAGNGGSAADAQHFTSELIGRLDKKVRPGIPSICINTNVSIMTALSNDFGYEKVFSKQIETLGNSGDTLVAISTSGNSENIIEACQIARLKNINIISLTGKTGGGIFDLSDVCIKVPTEITFLIQNVHIVIIHALCEMLENRLFEEAIPCLKKQNQPLAQRQEKLF